MYPKSHCANLYSGGNPWYTANYQPSNAQLFAASAVASSDADGQPPMYYPPHMFQSSSPDWHDSFSTPPSVNGGLLQAPATPSAGHHHHHLHHHHHASNAGSASEHLNDGLQSIPSPPITVSGSEMSSPGGGGVNGGSAAHNGIHGAGGGGGGGSASPHQMSMRPGPVKSPFEWIKRTSYQNQTNPGRNTRIRDRSCIEDMFRQTVMSYLIGPSVEFHVDGWIFLVIWQPLKWTELRWTVVLRDMTWQAQNRTGRLMI